MASSSDSFVIIPAPISVHLAVIVTATTLVGLLFLLVYVQLMMVLCFGYRLVSYQTVFLFSILFWASIRLILYSCYYFECCEFVTHKLPLFWSWFLEHLPASLQYFTLALLVHYFAGELLNERRRASTSLTPRFYEHCRRFVWIAWLLSILIHLASNATFGFIIPLLSAQTYLLLLRVLVLDGLMLIMSIALATSITLVFRTKGGKNRMMTQGALDLSKCWSLFLSGALVLIYLTRAIYTIVAFNLITTHGSTTDMVDHLFGNEYGYIAYLVELLLWEVVPTYLIVVYFRVKIPWHLVRCPQEAKSDVDVLVNQKYFFDNPNRYDAEVWAPQTAQVAVPRPISPSRAGYGSVPPQCSISYPGRLGVSINTTPMPGTTPPKLFGDSPSVFAT
eukprot:Em0019g547a